jgi:CRISPR-associated protein Cas1
LEAPLSSVKHITLLAAAATISAELLREVSARGIGVHIIGADGRPVVRIGPIESAEYDLTALQARLAASRDGLVVAQRMILGKIRNQVNLLRYFGKRRDRRGGGAFFPAQTLAVTSMETTLKELRSRAFGDDLELERGRLFAAEGQAASSYWAALRLLVWRNVGFERRVRQGADDLVNVLLNYGYGILYSRMLRLLLRSGMNANIGFLHKPRGGKPVLLYDVIEEFRAPAVDRVVFGLLNLGAEFALESGRLAGAGKAELAKAVLARLRSPTRYRSGRLPMEEAMEEQILLLRRHVEGKDEYRPWVWQW